MRAMSVVRRGGMAVLFAVALAAPMAAWSKGLINVTFFGSEAVSGYDAVAYFTDGTPVKGRDEFQAEWMGAKWFFASAEHRDLFKVSPEKYAPQYGGYCAYMMAQGKVADANPTVWRIVNDKLYLFNNKGVKKEWEEDVPGNIQKGDKNYPGVLK